MGEHGYELRLVSGPERADRPARIPLTTGKVIRICRGDGSCSSSADPLTPQTQPVAATFLNAPTLSASPGLVSRMHAEIWVDDSGSVLLADGGRSSLKESVNGTAVCGELIPPRATFPVPAGAEVEFGAPHLKRPGRCKRPAEFVYQLVRTPSCVAGPPPPPPPPRSFADLRRLAEAGVGIGGVEGAAEHPVRRVHPRSGGAAGRSTLHEAAPLSSLTAAEGDWPPRRPERPEAWAWPERGLPSDLCALLGYALPSQDDPLSQSQLSQSQGSPGGGTGGLTDDAVVKIETSRAAVLQALALALASLPSPPALPDAALELLWARAFEPRFSAAAADAVGALRGAGAAWLADAAAGFWRQQAPARAGARLADPPPRREERAEKRPAERGRGGRVAKRGRAR